MAFADSWRTFLGVDPASVRSDRRPEQAEGTQPPQFEHLQWLNAVDQRVHARGKCGAALRSERAVCKTLKSTISAYTSSIEHLRAASESDPEWFTSDVQDSHARRIQICQDMLEVLETDPLDAPEDLHITDDIRGRMYGSFAHTVQATTQVIAKLEERLPEPEWINERVAAAEEAGQFAANAMQAALSAVTAQVTENLGLLLNEPAQPISNSGYYQLVELICVQRKGNASFRCAVAEMQGWRATHEDAHAIECNGSFGSFWVLDGHAGAAAARLGAPALVEALDVSSDVAVELPSNERIEQAFEEVDKNLRRTFCANPAASSGSTVIGALAQHQLDGSYTLKLANCGDSRIVLCRSKDDRLQATTSAVSVKIPAIVSHESNTKADGSSNTDSAAVDVLVETIDHKPDMVSEKARIEDADGFVTQQCPPRLDGILAVSRALGDFEFKADGELSAADQKVSCIPDIYEISGISAGTVLLLGCDGIWDVMSSESVAAFVCDRLQQDAQVDLGKLAADALRTCLLQRSTDNMTLMIVHFADGSDWDDHRDEMLGFSSFFASPPELEVAALRRSVAFLRMRGFEPHSGGPCVDCGRWFLGGSLCPCGARRGEREVAAG